MTDTKKRRRPPKRVRQPQAVNAPEAMARFAASHNLGCFKCGSQTNPWAKTGISQRGPWAICKTCVVSKWRPKVKRMGKPN